MKEKKDSNILDFLYLAKSKKKASDLLRNHNSLIKDMVQLDAETVKLKGSVDFYLKNARQVQDLNITQTNEVSFFNVENIIRKYIQRKSYLDEAT